MKITCLSLLIFSCIFINDATAQAGYIVNLKNDTLRGEFKTTAFGRPKFMAANATAPVSVNLDTIKEYQLTKDGSVL